MTSRSRTSWIAAAVVVAMVLVPAAACSGDDSSDGDSGDGTTTTLAEGQTIRFDEQVQKDLAAVGCHPGTVDGVMGPKTDEAIKAFQAASGLTVDGELGPDADRALRTAVDDDEKVCGADAPTTTAAPDASTTTAAPSGRAPCTATALLGGLPAEGETITSFVCAGDYAAGTVSGGSRFILQSTEGRWFALGEDPCGGADAGLPPVILEDGCSS